MIKLLNYTELPLTTCGGYIILMEYFTSNSGDRCVVLNSSNKLKTKIKFLDEYGYEGYYRYYDLKRGEFKNPYNKSVMGVAMLGDISFVDKKDKSYKMAYKYWLYMLRRVYDKKYNPYNIDNHIQVCKDWHIFANFYIWFINNFRWDLYELGIKLELDKDFKSGVEDKIYSPDTCLFINSKANSMINYIDSKNYRLFINGKYQVYTSYNGRFKHIAYTTTENEAIELSNRIKKQHINEIIYYLINILQYDIKNIKNNKNKEWFND